MSGIAEPGEHRLSSTGPAPELQVEDLAQLNDMSVRLSANLQLQQIVDEVLRAATAMEHAHMGLLSLCDSEERNLRISATLGFEHDALLAIGRVPWHGRACGVCFRERRRIIVRDVSTEPAFAAYADAARIAGFRSIHSTPLITPSGKISGVVSTHFRQPHQPSERDMQLADICARQSANFIENACLYQQLEESGRHKDEFLVTLAHELRNPLAALSNGLHILSQAHGSSGVPERVRRMMDRQVRHMARLVEELLELSRITRGSIELRVEQVDLAAIVQSAIETSRPAIEEAGHRLEVRLPGDPIPVDVDPVRISQVLANLLDNAAKYTPAGGLIWLRLERGASEAVISVRDSGVGIRADLLPLIFDLFVQGPRSAEHSHAGLGIGLTLVRKLVQLHGGRVEAHSEGPGCGSEFIVHLPLGAAALAASGVG